MKTEEEYNEIEKIMVELYKNDFKKLVRTKDKGEFNSIGKTIRIKIDRLKALGDEHYNEVDNYFNQLKYKFSAIWE